MDNASCNTKMLNKMLSKYATKTELTEWLEKRKIPHSDNMRKIQLCEIITANALPEKKIAWMNF